MVEINVTSKLHLVFEQQISTLISFNVSHSVISAREAIVFVITGAASNIKACPQPI